MVEVLGARSFLHFTPGDSDPNSIPGMGSISSEERRDESDDDISRSDSDDIQMAER